MWKRRVSMCQGVVLLLGVLLPAHALANRIQLPGEPNFPTSREQCDSLVSQYDRLLERMRVQEQQCYGSLSARDYQQRAQTPNCASSPRVARCAPVIDARCALFNNRMDAGERCFARLREYRRQVEAEERQARERERQEREARRRDASQREAWERQAAQDLRPILVPVRPTPQASARQSERVTRFPAHSGGSTQTRGSEGHSHSAAPELQARMAKSALRNARAQYLDEVAGMLENTALGPYLRMWHTYEAARSSASTTGDFLAATRNSGTLEAAQQWFGRNANVNDTILDPFGASALRSVSNPVARVIMGTSLGMLQDHKAEMLRQSETLMGMIDGVVTPQQSTLPWQRNFEFRAAAIGDPKADPMQEWVQVLTEVVAGLAREQQIRAAENRRVMANAAEARRVEEERRKRAEEARLAEAARQEQARRNAAQADADRRAREAQRQRALEQQRRQAQSQRQSPPQTPEYDDCAEMERAFQQIQRQHGIDHQTMRQARDLASGFTGCR